MADEGSRLMMTELLLEEKELKAKLAALDAKLVEPLARLAKARELVLKAKTAYERSLAAVRPLQSDKILIEGELELLLEKKSEVRMEARKAEVGGIRPGTAEFVEHMNKLAGDPEVARLKKATADAEVDQELAAMKALLAGKE